MGSQGGKGRALPLQEKGRSLRELVGAGWRFELPDPGRGPGASEVEGRILGLGEMGIKG